MNFVYDKERKKKEVELKFEKEIENFVEKINNSSQPIVLITSGGTTVPLETRTVRFLDNFSVGTRGSTAAEYFLWKGYKVIFLHRRGSLQPFNRHFQYQNFLSMFCHHGNKEIGVTKDNKNDDNNQNIQQDIVKLKDNWLPIVTRNYLNFIKYKNNILLVEFTTLAEYLHLLEFASKKLSKYKERVLLFLAAAVSDFYVPQDYMASHKIQSSKGPLNLSLHLVPKLLKPLVAEIVPRAFVVSFKLETDKNLLLSKCKKALATYNHQVVIGNQLETRKWEVVIVTKKSEKWIKINVCNVMNNNKNNELYNNKKCIKNIKINKNKINNINKINKNGKIKHNKEENNKIINKNEKEEGKEEKEEEKEEEKKEEKEEEEEEEKEEEEEEEEEEVEKTEEEYEGVEEVEEIIVECLHSMHLSHINQSHL